MRQSDVIVVGGGASGLVAAISAAREDAIVTVIEKQDRIGKKILSTGNGRCNLSNASIAAESSLTKSANKYNNPGFVEPTLAKYDCEAIREFFKSIGLLTIVDEKGWVFPRTRYASSVVDVLLRECHALNINIVTNSEVKQIKYHLDDGQDLNNHWQIITDTGNYFSKALVLATGYSKLATQLGLIMADPQGILGSIAVEASGIQGLDGVRTNCRVSLLSEKSVIAHEDGEVLFKKQGLSGIVMFNISRFAQKGHAISLDLFPELSKAQLTELISCRQGAPATLLKGLLHSRLAQAVIRQANSHSKESAFSISDKDSDEEKPLKPQELSDLVQTIKDFRIEVTGTPDKSKAQVTRGGISTYEFNNSNLQSRKFSTLYAAGECLDIDGPCGGYNLHWAWASGIIAGQEAAKHQHKKQKFNTIQTTARL